MTSPPTRLVHACLNKFENAPFHASTLFLNFKNRHSTAYLNSNLGIYRLFEFKFRHFTAHLNSNLGIFPQILPPI